MSHATFAEISAGLSRGELQVASVGAFWGEARLIGRADAEHAVIAVPVTLHLAGKLETIAYAEMPVAVGRRRRGHGRRGLFARLAAKLHDRRRAGLLRYSLPDQGLSWRNSEANPDAVRIAAHFGRILAEEFPRPDEELARHFHRDVHALVDFLAQLGHGAAGTTQPDER